MMGLDMRRMRAIARRHAIVFKRSPHRWFDVAAPAIDSILFGSLAVVLSKSTPGDDKTVPTVLTGLLLFHILFASNLALVDGLPRRDVDAQLAQHDGDPAARNRVPHRHRGVRPQQGLHRDGLRLVHRVCSSTRSTSRRSRCSCYPARSSCCSWAGCWRSSSSAWCSDSVPAQRCWPGHSAFLLWPLSGAFYAVGALPAILQPIARILPTTHAFAASRAVVAGDPLPWDEIAIAAVGSIVLAALALWWVRSRLEQFRQRGYITRYSCSPVRDQRLHRVEVVRHDLVALGSVEQVGEVRRAARAARRSPARRRRGTSPGAPSPARPSGRRVAAERARRGRARPPCAGRRTMPVAS